MEYKYGHLKRRKIITFTNITATEVTDYDDHNSCFEVSDLGIKSDPTC